MQKYMMSFQVNLWFAFVMILITVSGCKAKEAVTLTAETELFSETAAEIAEEELSDGTIMVYVCGAVSQPGVIELPAGARVYEALAACGGLTDEADERQLNQAALVADGTQITVWTKEEAETANSSKNGQTAEQSGGKININQATAEELKTLPGIGDAKAADIIQYREQQGGFQSIEEIKNISGIKDAVFEKIRDSISV